MKTVIQYLPNVQTNFQFIKKNSTVYTFFYLTKSPKKLLFLKITLFYLCFTKFACCNEQVTDEARFFKIKL